MVLSYVYSFSAMKYLFDAISCFLLMMQINFSHEEIQLRLMLYIFAYVLFESDDKYHFRRKNPSFRHIPYEGIALYASKQIDSRDRSIVVKKVNISLSAYASSAMFYSFSARRFLFLVLPKNLCALFQHSTLYETVL